MVLKCAAAHRGQSQVREWPVDNYDNIVMFPASKHYRPAPGLESQDVPSDIEQLKELEHSLSDSAQTPIDDPLEELLREGNFPEIDMDEDDMNELKAQAHISALIETYQRMIDHTRTLSGPMAQASRLQILSAIQQRISYYVGELERYLPGRGMH
jgi:hypothetical protein